MNTHSLLVAHDMVCHTIRGGGDIDITVEVLGAGQPVLLVHGYSQSRMSWRKQLRSDLTTDLQLVAMDSRGHGDSAKPRDAYDDPQLWADDIRSIIEALDIDDVVLVGWSYGGLVVLDYLASYGTDKVSGLNLVGGVFSIGTDVGTDLLGQEYIDLLPGFVSTNVEESTQTMCEFVELCVHDTLPPEDRYYMLGYNMVVPPHVRDSLRSRQIKHDTTLSELDVPVLLTHGTEDAVVLPEASQMYAEFTDDSELSLYSETGHSPFWERPERFNHELRTFALDL